MRDGTRHPEMYDQMVIFIGGTDDILCPTEDGTHPGTGKFAVSVRNEWVAQFWRIEVKLMNRGVVQMRL
jgi:ribonucleotide monophosphatase NagD (HAD superfamily)